MRTGELREHHSFSFMAGWGLYLDLPSSRQSSPATFNLFHLMAQVCVTQYRTQCTTLVNDLLRLNSVATPQVVGMMMYPWPTLQVFPAITG